MRPTPIRHIWHILSEMGLPLKSERLHKRVTHKDLMIFYWRYILGMCLSYRPIYMFEMLDTAGLCTHDISTGDPSPITCPHIEKIMRQRSEKAETRRGAS